MKALTIGVMLATLTLTTPAKANWWVQVPKTEGDPTLFLDVDSYDGSTLKDTVFLHDRFFSGGKLITGVMGVTVSSCLKQGKGDLIDSNLDGSHVHIESWRGDGASTYDNIGTFICGLIRVKHRH